MCLGSCTDLQTGHLTLVAAFCSIVVEGVSEVHLLSCSASSSSSSSQSSFRTLCLTAYQSRPPPVRFPLLPGSLWLAPVLAGVPDPAAAAAAVPGSGFTRALFAPGVTAGTEVDAILPALMACKGQGDSAPCLEELLMHTYRRSCY